MTSGSESSVFAWSAVTSVTAFGLAWTLPLSARVMSDVVHVAWLILSNVR